MTQKKVQKQKPGNLTVQPETLRVRKTYKLYIDGKFPRSESGRSFQLKTALGEVQNISRASRKDLRNAVVAARKAYGTWKGATPILRGQILYRLAEMMEARSAELVMRVQEATRWPTSQAQEELRAAIDRVVWFAGWADKWQAVLGTINPVAGPYFNISYHEPTGVVAVVAPKNSPLLGLVSVVLASVVSGNGVVVLAEEQYSAVAMTWAEMLATSDLPGGVINVLTGLRSELLEPMYLHMDVNAIAHPDRNLDLTGDQLQKLLAPQTHNLKRLVGVGDWTQRELGPSVIAQFTEVKTVWHPAQLP